MAVVILRGKYPKIFTFGVMSDIFGKDKKTIHDIYERDKDRYGHLVN